MEAAMFFFDPMYLLVVGPTLLLALWAQFRVKAAYARYSKIPNQRGASGARVAEDILRMQGIHGVRVERIDGMLSDHYDPRGKVLRLSTDVHDGSSVAAIGIAAHEAGHAIQHARAYTPLILRQTIAPVAAVSSNLAFYVMLAGMLFASAGLFQLGVIAFAAGTVFSLVTLPVEFDASRRARELLPQLGFVSAVERKAVSKVLGAAAMTYVAAAVSSVVTLLYFLIRAGLLGGDE
jgi:uncharacterized protein